MKKPLLISCMAALLCACVSGSVNIKPIEENLWQQDPMDMCSDLIEKNQQDLHQIQNQYSDDVAQEVASLYQELDLQSNAICRSRIVQQAQVEKLKELRVEYLKKINTILSQEK